MQESESHDAPLSDKVLDGFVGRLLDAHIATVPPVVYHYTTAAGALGIVSGPSLWATDVRFLNDSSEWDYTLSLLGEVVAGRGATRDAWDGFRHELSALRGMTTYVACFSARRDHLSQWRAYSGRGYSLGFVSPLLSSLASAQSEGAIFASVVYERDTQLEMLNSLLDDLSASDPGAVDTDGIPHRTTAVGALSVAAAFFKDSAFADEEEWRVAVLPRPGENSSEDALSFRTNSDSVVPFRVLHMNSLGPHALHSIVVSPGPHPDMARAGMEELLKKFGHTSTLVSTSVVPFRG